MRSNWKLGLAALFAPIVAATMAAAEDLPSPEVGPTGAVASPDMDGPIILVGDTFVYRDSTARSPFEDEEAPAEQPVPAPPSALAPEGPPATEIPLAPIPDGETAPRSDPSAGYETETMAPAESAGIYQPIARQPAPPQPWHLPQPCVLRNHGILLGGWLQQGLTLNGQVPADRFNGPVGTNDRHAEYQMNQLWLFLNKPIDNAGRGFDVGGRLDVIYGSDSRFGVNWGLENRINGENQPYGLVIPQMYAEVAYGPVSVKLGHFAGILSYEQVPSVANFFYSHSYAMYFTEPLLVTGVLADVKLTGQWSIQAGFNRGWMMWEDLNEDYDFMGGIRWTSLDGGTSLAYSVDVGPQDPVAGAQNRFASSLLLQRRLNKKLRYVLQHNLGFENNGDPRSSRDAEWYGLNQYLFYDINQTWAAGLRVEWLRDDDGLFYGPGNVPGNSRAWAGGPGFAGDWFEISAGLNWRPHPNVIVRPEFRYDTYNGTTDVKGNLPFDDGTKSYQCTVAADVIFTY